MISAAQDIRRALAGGAYASALSLALTLPDICGQIADPTSNVRERYANWFNEWVAPSFWSDVDTKDYGGDQLRFDGAKCYQLRCAVLHSGDTDGITVDGHRDSAPLDEFELSVFPSSSAGLLGVSRVGVRSTGSSKVDERYLIRLDVIDLCNLLTTAAEAFYAQLPDKSIFDRHQLRITDMDAVADSMQEWSHHGTE